MYSEAIHWVAALWHIHGLAYVREPLSTKGYRPRAAALNHRAGMRDTCRHVRFAMVHKQLPGAKLYSEAASDRPG